MTIPMLILKSIFIFKRLKSNKHKIVNTIIEIEKSKLSLKSNSHLKCFINFQNPNPPITPINVRNNTI